MSTSFWKAENSIPIEQTSKSVPVLNGLDFSAGQEVRINVPPSTKFIKPDECYIQGDFKIKLPTLGATTQATRLQLDPRLGGQSLIKDIRIYSSAEFGNVLLEEIQDYNSMVSVMRDYDTNDSEKKKRAMTEGATIWIPETRGNLGQTRSECSDTFTNPYSKETFTAGNKTTAFTDTNFLSCKLCLPLETGIFRSPKIWANMYTGLQIVITLEDAPRVLTQLDSVSRSKRQRLLPQFHSLNGSIAGPNDWGDNACATVFYINGEVNSQLTPEACGLVVGERINFVAPDNSKISTLTLATPEILSIEAGVDAFVGLLKVTLKEEVKNETGIGGQIVKKSWFVYSDSVSGNTAPSGYDASYTLSNVELVVQEVDMGSNYVSDLLSRMKESGSIMNDILSVTNYKYSQSKDDVVANIRLPLTQARAKAILCQATDATAYTNTQRIGAVGTYDIGATANEDGQLLAGDQFRGISDHVSDYQFVYDGRLQPSRPVDCRKTSSKLSISAQPIIESQKALVQSGINVRSLGDFNRNFVIGRALSMSVMGVEGVYDTRGKDFNLQVNYSGVAPTKNKLWNNFVFHLRRVVIKGDSVSVVV
tara:strand:+ start:83 stop:1858 length:1776 start_codon:yes stop_codon:yes gene_type:complete